MVAKSLKQDATRAISNYLACKAQHQTAEKRAADYEASYIVHHNILHNGAPIAHLWMIEDEEEFDRHNQACYGADGFAEIQAFKNRAWDRLLDAERELLGIVFRTFPAGMQREADALRKACRSDYQTKQKVIDVFLRLDVETLPSALHAAV